MREVGQKLMQVVSRHLDWIGEEGIVIVQPFGELEKVRAIGAQRLLAAVASFLDTNESLDCLDEGVGNIGDIVSFHNWTSFAESTVSRPWFPLKRRSGKKWAG